MRVAFHAFLFCVSRPKKTQKLHPNLCVWCKTTFVISLYLSPSSIVALLIKVKRFRLQQQQHKQQSHIAKPKKQNIKVKMELKPIFLSSPQKKCKNNYNNDYPVKQNSSVITHFALLSRPGLVFSRFFSKTISLLNARTTDETNLLM